MKNINNTTEYTAIENLVKDYARYADSKELEKQVNLFAKDGEMIILPSEYAGFPSTTVKGHEQIRELIKTSLNPFPKTMHLVGQIYLEIDGNKAKGLAYTRAYHLISNPETKKLSTMVAVLKYHDEFIKIGDEWFFAKRNLVLDWVENQTI